MDNSLSLQHIIQHIIDLKEGQAALRTDVQKIKEDAAEIKKDLNSPYGLEKRITSLEHDRIRITAYSAAVSFIIGLAYKLFPRIT